MTPEGRLAKVNCLLVMYKSCNFLGHDEGLIIYDPAYLGLNQALNDFEVDYYIVLMWPRKDFRHMNKSGLCKQTLN